MTYRESLDKEVSSAISNIIGFTSAYILFYLLFGIPINFLVLCSIPCIFLAGFFLSGYIFYRHPRWKRRSFRGEIHDTVRIVLFLFIFIWLCPSYIHTFNLSIFFASATGAILALLLKGLFVHNEWFA